MSVETLGRAVIRMVGESKASGAVPAQFAPSAASKVAVVVPAHNEERTIGAVIDAIRGAKLVDEILVVNNNSCDATAAVAARHGARVIEETTPGKGQAMTTGVRATDADVIVFVDADQRGLRPDHVDRLIEPVLAGRAVMTRGLTDRGFMELPFPFLTGQRAMHRDLFLGLPDIEREGWRIETALNLTTRKRNLPVETFVLDGTGGVPKEVKYANSMSALEGWKEKGRMYSRVLGERVQWRIRHAGEDTSWNRTPGDPRVNQTMDLGALGDVELPHRGR